MERDQRVFLRASKLLPVLALEVLLALLVIAVIIVVVIMVAT